MATIPPASIGGFFCARKRPASFGLAAHKLAVAEERIAELKERLDEMRHERDRARAGEDAWKAQCETVSHQLALPAPKDAQPTQASRLRRVWRWMQATG